MAPATSSSPAVGVFALSLLSLACAQLASPPSMPCPGSGDCGLALAVADADASSLLVKPKMNYQKHYKYQHRRQCPKPSGRSQNQKGENLVCGWEGKFIVTRLWNLVQGPGFLNFTSEQVVEIFQEGFGVDVVAYPGFLAYLGSTTDQPLGLPFFSNVFDTEEGALLAQNGAARFVAEGVLNAQITPNTFTSGRIQFQFTNQNLCDDAVALITGEFLSLRFWTPKTPGTAQDVLDIFEVGFAPIIQTFPGFLMYLGAKVVDRDNTELAFFLNVFSDRDQALAANEAAAAFARGDGDFADTPCGGLVSELADVDASTGLIDFAFLAALRQQQSSNGAYKPYRAH